MFSRVGERTAGQYSNTPPPCSSSNYGARQAYSTSVTHTMTTMQRMLNEVLNLF